MNGSLVSLIKNLIPVLFWYDAIMIRSGITIPVG